MGIHTANPPPSSLAILHTHAPDRKALELLAHLASFFMWRGKMISHRRMSWYRLSRSSASNGGYLPRDGRGGLLQPARVLPLLPLIRLVLLPVIGPFEWSYILLLVLLLYYYQ